MLLLLVVDSVRLLSDVDKHSDDLYAAFLLILRPQSSGIALARGRGVV